MNSTCVICNEVVIDDKHYWHKHKIKMADYFVKYFPRLDKHTQEPIVFKNKEQYFEADFINKNNLKAYLKSSSVPEAQEYCKNLLIKRKENRKLRFAPSQVELRSIISPTVIFYDKVFPQGYQGVCQEVGLINRFQPLTTTIPLPSEIPTGNVYIDTREQKSLKLPVPIEIKKLEYGDYHYSKDKFNVFVERKSMADFIGTLGKDLERFCREIERAQKDGAYLIVLVEESLVNCLSFNHLPWVNKFTKATPDFIFHNVRETLQTYSNIQFLFTAGRREAVSLLLKIFYSGQDFRTFDNQLAHDCHII